MLDRNTYRVIWSPDEGEYVGLCAEFPSLSRLAATAGSRTARTAGGFLARVPPVTHRTLVLRATEENVSLNQSGECAPRGLTAAVSMCEDADMAIHDVDAVDVAACPHGMREAADLTQTAVVAELEDLLGVTYTRNDADGAQRSESSRLAMLAAETYRRELLSEGQLARLLRLDRVELRKMLDDAGVDRTTDIKCRPHAAGGPGRA